AVTPRQVLFRSPGGVSLTFPNPFGITSLGPVQSTLLLGTTTALTVFSVILFAMAATSLVVRYRSGGLDLRQQIKWVAFAAVTWVAFQAALALAQTLSGTASPVTIILGFASALMAFVVIPIAIAVAILKYRLYEIDVIINRAVVYGLLAAAVTAVYVAVVVGIGPLIGYGAANPVLTTGAAVAVALPVHP